MAEKKGRTEGIAIGEAKGKAEGIEQGKAEGIAQGKAEGIAQGKAEGIAEGIAQGIEQERLAQQQQREQQIINSAKEMQKLGMSNTDIARINGISEVQLNDLLKGSRAQNS